MRTVFDCLDDNGFIKSEKVPSWYIKESISKDYLGNPSCVVTEGDKKALVSMLWTESKDVLVDRVYVDLDDYAFLDKLINSLSRLW